MYFEILHKFYHTVAFVTNRRIQLFSLIHANMIRVSCKFFHNLWGHALREKARNMYDPGNKTYHYLIM